LDWLRAGNIHYLVSASIILLLLILVASLVFFSFEWVDADVVGLGVLLALILSGLVPLDHAFAGFGSETVLVIFGLLILTTALIRTGVVDQAGRFILRRGAAMRQKLSTIRLKMGDVLLVQGDRGNIAALEGDDTMRVLGGVDETRVNTPRARLAVGIFVAALAVGSLELLPLPVAILLGAFALFATRTITPEEAYRLVEWRVLVLIGCMLAVGDAIT